MNVTSLAHHHAKNQQKSSWIDDPFELKGFVTGVTRVSDHKRALEIYALDMVGSFGKFEDDHYELDLDMLSSPYQLEFARLYIESIDREIEWACYGDDESINSEFLCALLAMLKDSNPKTRSIFSQVTTRNILVYYKDALNKILYDACDDFYTNEMNEAGYYCEQDPEHGDFAWRR